MARRITHAARYWCWSALLVALLFAGSRPALAHAHLSSSTPAENATVAAPDRLELSFTQALEKPFSKIELRDPAGRIVPNTTRLDEADPTRLGVGLPTHLQPGSYTVIWHATSVDTHRTEGTFRFNIAA